MYNVENIRLKILNVIIVIEMDWIYSIPNHVLIINYAGNYIKNSWNLPEFFKLSDLHDCLSH